MRDAQYVEYLREVSTHPPTHRLIRPLSIHPPTHPPTHTKVKRWLDAEEKAVLQALKKKEDDRVQDLVAREERKEEVQRVLSGLWSVSTTAVNVHPPTHPPTHPSIYSPTYLSTYLPTYLPTYFHR